MNKCFIKKLNVTVDNSNLPILEPMSQFTLDAITASGNSSMTDAQKWALNHFFYQIGAPDNTGIFAKLDFLYMPLICNQNVNKAFVDYKGSFTKTSADYVNVPVFSGNGIVSDNLSSKTAVAVSTHYEEIRALTSYSAILGTKDIPSVVGGMIAGATNNYTILNRSNTNTTFRLVDGQNELQYTGKATGTDVAILTVDNGSYTSKIVNNGVVYSDFTKVAASSPASIPERYSFTIMTRGIPEKIFAFGACLTETEERTLAIAMHDLMLAFPDPVNNG